MPTYQVLRCVKCESFQIQQLKKVPKWSCVTCGTKQSTMRIYAESTVSSELSKIVKDYNMKRGQIEAQRTITTAKASHPALRADVPPVPQMSTQSLDSLRAHVASHPPTLQSSYTKQVPTSSHSQSFSPQETEFTEFTASSKSPDFNSTSIANFPSSSSEGVKPTSPKLPSSSSPGFVSPFSRAATSKASWSSSIASSKVEIIEESRP